MPQGFPFPDCGNNPPTAHYLLGKWKWIILWRLNAGYILLRTNKKNLDMWMVWMYYSQKIPMSEEGLYRVLFYMAYSNHFIYYFTDRTKRDTS